MTWSLWRYKIWAVVANSHGKSGKGGSFFYDDRNGSKTVFD